MQAGRVRAPGPVDDLFGIGVPSDRRPVRTCLGRPSVEEACGEEGDRLVHRPGLLQQVAGGTLAQAGGEALGQAVAAGQLREGGDDAHVQPRGPAAHPPGGQRHPGQQPVPARVGEPDLLLRDDPQSVVHRLCTLGRRGRDPALHLGRVPPAAAQQEPRHPAQARARRPGQRVAPARRGHRHRGVQAPYEAPGRGYVGVRRGSRTGDDRGEDGAQLAHPHPPQERRADDQDGRRDGTPAAGRVAQAGQDVVGPVRGRRCVARRGTVLQPAVAVRGERYRRGGGDVEPVGQVPHHPVQLGRRLLGDRDRGGHGGPGAGHDQGDPGGGQQDEQREDAHDPADDVPARAHEAPGGPADQEDHGRGGGQQGHGQRAAADPQHRQRPGARRERAHLHTTSTGHGRTSPPHRCPVCPVCTRPSCCTPAPPAPSASPVLLTPPTVAPGTDIAMPVGQVPERMRGTIVGAPAPVSRMAHRSPDGMALGKGGDGQQRSGPGSWEGAGACRGRSGDR